MNRALSVVLLGVVLASFATADEEPKPQNDREKRLNQQLQKLNQKYAEEYAITRDGDEQPLKWNPEPVFHWLNPARINNPRLQMGAVYVWTKEGRAETVGTIFSTTKEGEPATFYHEFHSLATGPLKAMVNRTVKWDTPDPGVEFKAFPETAAPAETPARRMTEMRALARKFSGYSINYDDARWGLNLLPQPLYRMPKPTDQVLDQTVFALISTAGTDPEVLLVIEARKVKDSYQWQYSVCRFTDLKTWVSYGDQEVWSFTNGTKGPTVDADIRSRYRFINAGSVRVEL